ncbi:isopenicillin N synthase-like dioxygenase [Microbacteriaceae bacterium SG_E_30_P1]|uniref:Isopenicillin N synthase-like dioxygenase n=1 Tax=Antiquaquibacter oligotrophicus TaxID=2880260 RepID=A0ABT6KNI2_9MICO|nr:2-oxoglutarate and iron-dependent oxygenase domain-containing protein [Antiquaquibacter oligotrophicus]MDH6181566.1 isopenicillin N synthase-like dioxygenase [Antiquaquibacter oligotrophicus]UDF12746.1 isopenicillin N synthase family oxygenase [Antiquaquibacter oligotrophicus]
MAFEVPTVDITPYVKGGSPEEKAAVARAWDDACRTVGFVQVIGHGVPDETIDGLKQAIDDFFAQNMDTKMLMRTPRGVNRGYSPPKSESLSLSLGVVNASLMNDFFEAFNVGLTRADYPGVDLPESEYQENVWPDVPLFRDRVMAYFAEARRVAETLVTIFPDALELPADFFADATTHNTATMRINNYALPPGTVDLDGELRGMGEHTDYDIVTVLWADQVKGLQVLGTDGSWNDVNPADGALLVNLADNMAGWTNDQWMSTLHRVKPPVIDGRIERRRSVAYFHGGRPDAVIAPIPELLAPGEELHYEPITVAEHRKAKLAGSRGGRLNTKAEREAARVRASAG